MSQKRGSRKGEPKQLVLPLEHVSDPPLLVQKPLPLVPLPEVAPDIGIDPAVGTEAVQAWAATAVDDEIGAREGDDG